MFLYQCWLVVLLTGLCSARVIIDMEDRNAVINTNMPNEMKTFLLNMMKSSESTGSSTTTTSSTPDQTSQRFAVRRTRSHQGPRSLKDIASELRRLTEAAAARQRLVNRFNNMDRSVVIPASQLGIFPRQQQERSTAAVIGQSARPDQLLVDPSVLLPTADARSTLLSSLANQNTYDRLDHLQPADDRSLFLPKATNQLVVPQRLPEFVNQPILPPGSSSQLIDERSMATEQFLSNQLIFLPGPISQLTEDRSILPEDRKQLVPNQLRLLPGSTNQLTDDQSILLPEATNQIFSNLRPGSSGQLADDRPILVPGSAGKNL